MKIAGLRLKFLEKKEAGVSKSIRRPEDLPTGEILTPFDVSLDDFHEHRSSGIVSPWLVRRRDICFLVRFFQETGCTNILNPGCGSGFVSSLIAMEGLPVTGTDDLGTFLSSPFRHSLLTLREGVPEGISNLEEHDGFLLCRPGSGQVSDEVLGRVNARGIAFIIETSSLTGNVEGPGFTNLLSSYRPIVYWDNICYKDLNSALFRIISGGSSGEHVPEIFKTSHSRVILLVRREMDPRRLILSLQQLERQSMPRYSWETEMDRYYRVGEHLTGSRSILWTLRTIPGEIDFLREIAYNGFVEKGLVL